VYSYHVTGNFDYLLQVEVTGPPAYEDFHANQPASLPGVAMVTSNVAMKTFAAGRGGDSLSMLAGQDVLGNAAQLLVGLPIWRAGVSLPSTAGACQDCGWPRCA
jgi:Lrp/AsnC ligand binding domain